MKVFWSWQSDIPGKIGRHFVRSALQSAIDSLKEEAEITEPDRLHLDHDRKGVPGSPDLARTILDKISESAVFVADVTPVGRTESGKPLLNPNVAIELGYALALLGDERFLMVLNTAWGDRNTLPFDLRQKAGPITYSLAEGTAAEERQRVQRDLTGDLKVALRDCLAAPGGPGSRTTQHDEVESRATVAQYFDDNEPLVPDRDRHLSYPACPLLYLRLIPSVHSPKLRNSQIKDTVFGIHIKPFRSGASDGDGWGLNRYGGITYSVAQHGTAFRLLTSSQLFHNREIWGVDSTFLSRTPESLHSVAVEQLFETALRHYLEVATEYLDLHCPLRVEAGASRIQGFKIAMPSNFWDESLGPILQPHIRSRHTLSSFDDVDVRRVLLAVFEDFFDAASEKRPENFRGFPES